MMKRRTGARHRDDCTRGARWGRTRATRRLPLASAERLRSDAPESCDCGDVRGVRSACPSPPRTRLLDSWPARGNVRSRSRTRVFETLRVGPGSLPLSLEPIFSNPCTVDVGSPPDWQLPVDPTKTSMISNRVPRIATGARVIRTVRCVSGQPLLDRVSNGWTPVVQGGALTVCD